MKKIVSVLLCIFLFTSLLFSFNGCESNVQKSGTKDLMADVEPQVYAYDMPSLNRTEFENTCFDLSVNLLKQNQFDENVLLSPLSILFALAMSENGAKNSTLIEYETLLGIENWELNYFLEGYNLYRQNKLELEDYPLQLANSIWFRNSEDFTVDENFLQRNANVFNAQIYSSNFNEATVDDINKWVKENTDGMIPSIIDRLDERAVMCIINALTFEADWDEQYNEYQVREGSFYSLGGTRQNAEFMYSDEYKYLCDDKSTGFIKYYEGQNYAFVALLPNENVKFTDYITSLTGKKVLDLLSNAQDTKVKTKLPKFEYSFETELSDQLKALGLKLPFDVDNADFSGIGTYADGNIYISKILHKTYISVAEKGTRAGAVTAEILNGSSAPQKEIEVYLDRPFVYMILDCDNNIPIFMGAVTNLE